jgi:hypothetical protein
MTPLVRKPRGFKTISGAADPVDLRRCMDQNRAAVHRGPTPVFDVVARWHDSTVRCPARVTFCTGYRWPYRERRKDHVAGKQSNFYCWFYSFVSCDILSLINIFNIDAPPKCEIGEDSPEGEASSVAIYWAYENWRASGHKVIVHKADCQFCNHGDGLNGGTRADNGAWHKLGDFASSGEALENARHTLSVPAARLCGQERV